MRSLSSDSVAGQTGAPEPSQNSNPSGQASQTVQQAGVQVSTEPDGSVVQSKQIGRYKVEVIRDKCIGAASCVAIAPKVFQLDESNIAIIISQDGNDDEMKLLAAQSCPTAAIIVTDTQTGQQVWPLV